MILNIDMLNALRDRPNDVINAVFREFPDGIISGFDVSVSENNITIGGGIVKHDGFIYTADETTICAETGRIFCTLDFSAETSNNCTITQAVPVFLREQPETEIFRYIHSEGSVLHGVPKNFNDIKNGLKNSIDISYRKISCSGGYIPDRKITETFAAELLEKRNTGISDTVFAYVCLNGLASPLPIIKYLMCGEDISVREMTERLAEKLDSFANEKSAQKPSVRKTGKRRVS